jgi:hypothetical protein
MHLIPGGVDLLNLKSTFLNLKSHRGVSKPFGARILYFATKKIRI